MKLLDYKGKEISEVDNYGSARICYQIRFDIETYYNTRCNTYCFCIKDNRRNKIYCSSKDGIYLSEKSCIDACKQKLMEMICL